MAVSTNILQSSPAVVISDKGLSPAFGLTFHPSLKPYSTPIQTQKEPV